LKVVFDTNVFISAFAIPGGKAEEAYLRATKGDFTLYSSVAILQETAQKLQDKFDWEKDRITQLLKVIAKIATIVKTQPHLHLLTDEPDNRILECAVEVKADFIVTGDRHLLSLRHFQDTDIITLSYFLETIKR
jgi:putative PIN family toxin of toxin-antitoxin system